MKLDSNVKKSSAEQFSEPQFNHSEIDYTIQLLQLKKFWTKNWLSICKIPKEVSPVTVLK